MKKISTQVRLLVALITSCLAGYGVALITKELNLGLISIGPFFFIVFNLFKIGIDAIICLIIISSIGGGVFLATSNPWTTLNAILYTLFVIVFLFILSKFKSNSSEG